MASRLTRPRRQPPSEQQEPQPRAKWTTSLTKTLADLMVYQVHKGNRQKNSFKKKAWMSMCEEFHNKTGLKWDKEQLKNRFSVLKRQYVTVKSLLDHGDFCWDESEGTIIATVEAWATYIKEHPDAENIRSGGCPLYKELCTIFSETTTNRNNNQLTVYDNGITDTPICPEPITTLRDESSSESAELDDTIEEQEKNQSTTNTAAAASSRKRGRKGIDDNIARAILEMASASKMRTDGIMKNLNKFSISDCVRELDVLQGVDEEVYFGALDLFGNRVAREVFLSLKPDKQVAWLNSKVQLHLVS